MDISLLQSMVALNSAAINDLHSRIWLFKDWAASEDCEVRKRGFIVKAASASKLIAKYVKIQKALKQDIAKLIKEQRNPFTALHESGLTEAEAAVYLENSDKTLLGYLKQPDGAFLASDLKKLKMELKGIL